MVEFCDLLGTAHAPVSKIPSVNGILKGDFVHTVKSTYRYVASSRPVYYSILDHFV